MPRASSLAAEIKSEFQIDAELVKLSGGCYEIYCDDELIYSKNELDRFPEDGEIMKLLQDRA